MTRLRRVLAVGAVALFGAMCVGLGAVWCAVLDERGGEW